MKTHRQMIWLGLLALMMAGCGSGGGDTDRTTLAVIPKGTSHIFWQSIHAGADRAARELDVDIIWRGPLREDDRSAQIAEVEGFISRGVDGIVLAPLDDTALVAPVADATRRGIPVVVIDSGLRGEDHISFVATDNRASGRLAGDGLKTMLPGGGKVVLLRYQEGSDSTTEREEGFLESVRAAGNLQILSDNQYGGTDVETAYRRSETLLSRFKTPDGRLDVQGIFTPNESTTMAMLRVLQDNGWAGQVQFVGFDASDTLVKALEAGHIKGLVLQDPVRMGYLGVQTMVRHLRGETVERRIDTGVRLVTQAEMNEPAARELLHPPLGPEAAR
jgi:ribose transport system substrate-binding protein